MMKGVSKIVTKFKSRAVKSVTADKYSSLLANKTPLEQSKMELPLNFIGTSMDFSTNKSDVTVDLPEFKLHRLKSGPPAQAELTRSDALKAYSKMVQIRRMENTLATLYQEKFIRGFCHLYVAEPSFGGPIANVTVPVGREAILACTVHDLSNFKVAWLRVDTQTILTIHNHVLTKSHRVGVTHGDRTWYLHLKEIRKTDRGWYMCQINTDPMKSQLGYLDVVVPPDIIDSGTSSDLVVREGASVGLKCKAVGQPMPQITWRREHGDFIITDNGAQVSSVEGPVLNISRVSRQHMGPYLCIASNGVPPTVSKRVTLIVQFPPVIWIQNQLVAAEVGSDLVLECVSEAYPNSVNYWTRENGELVSQGGDYEPQKVENMFKVKMQLNIRSVTKKDLGTYKCISKNSLGDTEGTITVYETTRPQREKSSYQGSRFNTVVETASGRVLPGSKEIHTLEEYEDTDSSTSSRDTASRIVVISLIIVLVNIL